MSKRMRTGNLSSPSRSGMTAWEPPGQEIMDPSSAAKCDHTEALRIPDTCSAQKSFYSFLWKNHEGSKSDIGLKKAYLRVVAWRCCP